ncbi:MAG: hypothetical protein ACK53Y_24785, partial [bacterium]
QQQQQQNHAGGGEHGVADLPLAAPPGGGPGQPHDRPHCRPVSFLLGRWRRAGLGRRPRRRRAGSSL